MAWAGSHGGLGQAPLAVKTHPVLQLPDLTGHQTVSFGDEWNDVHLLVQCLHEAHVHWPQPAERGRGSDAGIRTSTLSPGTRTGHTPVSEGGDEVQAAVHPVVLDILAVEATFITEILLKLLVHVVSDGLPTRSGGRRKLALRAAR